MQSDGPRDRSERESSGEPRHEQDRGIHQPILRVRREARVQKFLVWIARPHTRKNSEDGHHQR
jgi:hypothetical protein